MQPEFTFPSFIDATARNEFASCETKWAYGTLAQMERRPGSIHLHAGGAYARGLEVLRKSFYEDGLSLTDSIDKAQLAVLTFWGAVEPLFSWSAGNEDEKKTLDAVLGAIEFYPTAWPLETDHVQPIEMSPGKRAVEFTFAIPLEDCLHPVTGEPMLYTGRFDMLGSYNSLTMPVDDKTTSYLGKGWSSQWDLRAQFTGYCWACNEYGFSVPGLIIRGMAFHRTIKEGINFKTAEVITYRDEYQIQRWRKQLKKDFDRMVAAWKAQDYGVNLGDACTVYGQQCPFTVLCTSQRPEVWFGEYQKRDWNPLAKID